MNTVYKFPVSKLPAELREGFSSDEFVTVTIAGVNTDLPAFTDEQFDAMFASSYAQKERGEGTVCKTDADHDAFFDSIRSEVDAKYKPA